MAGAYVYIRTGCDHPAGTPQHDIQLKPCSERRQALGLADIGEFADIGMTGAAPLDDRPGGHQMLANLRCGFAKVKSDSAQHGRNYDGYSFGVSMFKRYADLFSEEEKRTRQREVQQRRSEWRKAQAKNVVVISPRQEPRTNAQSTGVN
jgi:hypothetical protein